MNRTHIVIALVAVIVAGEERQALARDGGTHGRAVVSVTDARANDSGLVANGDADAASPEREAFGPSADSGAADGGGAGRTGTQGVSAGPGGRPPASPLGVLGLVGAFVCLWLILERSQAAADAANRARAASNPHAAGTAPTHDLGPAESPEPEALAITPQDVIEAAPALPRLERIERRVDDVSAALERIELRLAAAVEMMRPRSETPHTAPKAQRGGADESDASAGGLEIVRGELAALSGRLERIEFVNEGAASQLESLGDNLRTLVDQLASIDPRQGGNQEVRALKQGIDAARSELAAAHRTTADGFEASQNHAQQIAGAITANTRSVDAITASVGNLPTKIVTGLEAPLQRAMLDGARSASTSIDARLDQLTKQFEEWFRQLANVVAARLDASASHFQSVSAESGARLDRGVEALAKHVSDTSEAHAKAQNDRLGHIHGELQVITKRLDATLERNRGAITEADMQGRLSEHAMQVTLDTFQQWFRAPLAELDRFRAGRAAWVPRAQALKDWLSTAERAPGVAERVVHPLRLRELDTGLRTLLSLGPTEQWVASVRAEVAASRTEDPSSVLRVMLQERLDSLTNALRMLPSSPEATHRWLVELHKAVGANCTWSLHPGFPVEPSRSALSDDARRLLGALVSAFGHALDDRSLLLQPARNQGEVVRVDGEVPRTSEVGPGKIVGVFVPPLMRDGTVIQPARIVITT